VAEGADARRHLRRAAHNSVVAIESTPLYVRLLAGLVRPFPNFDFGFIKPLRQKATALLRLGPGDFDRSDAKHQAPPRALARKVPAAMNIHP
jgi:hypothetical protein